LCDDLFKRLQRLFKTGFWCFGRLHAAALARGGLPVKRFAIAKFFGGTAFYFPIAATKLGQTVPAYEEKLLLIAPLSMLALAACNKTETPAAEGEAATARSSRCARCRNAAGDHCAGTYRCADNTIVHVDFLGKNEAADIRVGDKTAAAVRVTAPKVEAPAAPAEGAADAAALRQKSADGARCWPAQIRRWKDHAFGQRQADQPQARRQGSPPR
jgi:hypothetical protein